MKVLDRPLVLAACLIATGCGPFISESRMSYVPPRPENCEVKVVNVPTQELSLSAEYEIIGNIIVQSTDHQDPFDAEMLSEIRPRVCKMGGEDISLGLSTNVSGGGGATVYNVLKKKGGPRAALPVMSTRKAP
jgi:hypothetical protein